MKKVYLIALVFAILTGLSVYNYALFLQNSSKREVQNVVVALIKIPENTKLTEEMIELRELPVEAVNPLSVKKLSDAVGRVTNTIIESNEQVLKPNLNEIGADKSGLNYNIPQGKRAITVKVDEISGVAGYIKEGNCVDIIVSLILEDKTSDPPAKIEKTILAYQNITVLKTGSKNTDKNSAYSNVTLAMTPEQAVSLYYAQLSGRVTLVLRPVLDTETKDIPPYSPAAIGEDGEGERSGG